MRFDKKSVAGVIERLEVLRAHGVRLEFTKESALTEIQAGVDDVLDAAACLLTAKRIAAKQAVVLGDGALDKRGYYGWRCEPSGTGGGQSKLWSLVSGRSRNLSADMVTWEKSAPGGSQR